MEQSELLSIIGVMGFLILILAEIIYLLNKTIKKQRWRIDNLRRHLDMAGSGLTYPKLKPYPGAQWNDTTKKWEPRRDFQNQAAAVQLQAGYDAMIMRDHTGAPHFKD